MADRITDGESPVLNDMGQPADVANAIAALEWIAKHSSEAMRAPEASALLAEIERLRAQVEVAMEGYREAVSKARWQAVTNRELNQLGEELRAAKESLTASEKHAARYRWIRREGNQAASYIVSRHMLEGLDAAIDTAMEKANG